MMRDIECTKNLSLVGHLGILESSTSGNYSSLRFIYKVIGREQARYPIVLNLIKCLMGQNSFVLKADNETFSWPSLAVMPQNSLLLFQLYLECKKATYPSITKHSLI